MRLAVLALLFVMNSFGQVVITDSGSTNRPGMTVTIDEKGNAEIAGRRGNKAQMSLDKDLHTRLMKDLDAAMPLDQMAVRGCAKSVSFGSRMFLTYKGVRSPDMSCAGQTDAAVIALQKDAQEIMALAKSKAPASPAVQ
jgi:hypothetical protein